MKKKTLLTFATAAAICATTVGSYAAWDQLSASTSGDLTVNRIAVSATQSMTNSTADRAIDANPTFTSNATFDLSSAAKYSSKISGFQLAVEVKNGGTIVDPTNYTVSVKKGGTEVTNLLDNNPTYAVEQSYEVVVTLKDEYASTVTAEQTLTVNVTGELVPAKTA